MHFLVVFISVFFASIAYSQPLPHFITGESGRTSYDAGAEKMTNDGIVHDCNQQQGGQPVTFPTSPVFAGNRSLKYQTLQNGSSDNDRMECRVHKDFYPQNLLPQYLEYYIYIPSADFQASAQWLIWTQWQEPNGLINPPLVMQVGKNQTAIVTLLGRVSGSTFTIDTFPIDKDVWTHYQFKVKFGQSGSGRVEVWRNGIKETDWSGSLGGSGNPSMHVKTGIYRGGDSTNTQTVYFDNIHFGNSFPTAPPQGVDPTLDHAWVLRSSLNTVRVLINDDNGGMTGTTGFSVKVNASPVTVTSTSCTSIAGSKALCVVTHTGTVDDSGDVVQVSYDEGTGNVLDSQGQELDAFTDAAVTNWYDKAFNTDNITSSTASSAGREVQLLFDDVLSDVGSYLAPNVDSAIVDFDLVSAFTLYGVSVAGDNLGNATCANYTVQWSNDAQVYTQIVSQEGCFSRTLLTRAFAATTARYWRMIFAGPGSQLGVQVLELDAVEDAGVPPASAEIAIIQGGQLGGGIFR